MSFLWEDVESSTKALCGRQESHTSRSWGRRKKKATIRFIVPLLMASSFPLPAALLPHPVSLHSAGNSQPPPYHQPPTPHSLNSPKPQTSNSCIMAETATPVGLGLTTPFSSSSPFCSFSRLKFPGSVPFTETTVLSFLQITRLTQILLYSMTAVAFWADVRSSNKEWKWQSTSKLSACRLTYFN